MAANSRGPCSSLFAREIADSTARGAIRRGSTPWSSRARFTAAIWSESSYIVKLRGTPICSPSIRKIREQTAWKVPSVMSRPRSSPTRVKTRSRISRAALFVNVTARMRRGRTFLSRTKYAMRCAMTRVLPEPGPASIRSGPSVCSTASRWRGLRASRIGLSVDIPTMKMIHLFGYEVEGGVRRGFESR